ncbi:hypothetical protein AMEX_G8737 [Astyanax mexicanus]|uniref:CCHC-type domain-containing protein n=1 Tax=Astyanax mexicanus TaxID=7994 RepID=A0A8T2LWW5_ASTMX|nr:hypothetical protein AMEX_G8737 [Astyanax mexicanus]
MSTKQNEHESPQQFLYRMIGLKQRVLLASKHNCIDIAYEPRTVQNVFLRTISQGLLPKYSDIRKEIKPFLSDYTVSDDTLLRLVNQISSEESERQRRLGSCSRQRITHAHSAHLESDNDADKSTGTKAKTKSKTEQELSAKIDALTKVVESLLHEKSIESASQSMPNKSNFSRPVRPRSCLKCVDQGVSPCLHCFVCGDEGHRAVGCLKKKGLMKTSSPAQANANLLCTQQEEQPLEPDVKQVELNHLNAHCPASPFPREDMQSHDRAAQLVGEKCNNRHYNYYDLLHSFII